MLLATGWEEYKIFDIGDGEKLEKWGGITLVRPDPQVIWPKTLSAKVWNDVHAYYNRSNQGGGSWFYHKKFPAGWNIHYPLGIGKKLVFHIQPTSFKHTGLFPEQAANWEWMADMITKEKRPLRILNLFAYTGGATVACAAAGAEVCHVDASKGMVAKAKENLFLSGLANAPVRYIVDDVLKFVQREIRRGNQYDGIIMDPPSYGRGPKGEIWKIENELYQLVNACMALMSDRPLFFLLNSYTTGLAPSVQSNILLKTIGERFHRGKTTADEIGIPVSSGNLVLPCGSSGRWRV